jgi:hypothetical protein
LRLGTLVSLNIKCRRNILWVMTESSTAKARCSTDQRSMVTEMLWVSLEGRSRTNTPCQRFHLQLFCKIVKYFCRTDPVHIVDLRLLCWSTLLRSAFCSQFDTLTGMNQIAN